MSVIRSATATVLDKPSTKHRVLEVPFRRSCDPGRLCCRWKRWTSRRWSRLVTSPPRAWLLIFGYRRADRRGAAIPKYQKPSTWWTGHESNVGGFRLNDPRSIQSIVNRLRPRFAQSPVVAYRLSSCAPHRNHAPYLAAYSSYSPYMPASHRHPPPPSPHHPQLEHHRQTTGSWPLCVSTSQIDHRLGFRKNSTNSCTIKSGRSAFNSS